MTTWLHFALPLAAEILFLLTALICIYRVQKNRIYPALWQFLMFWAASDALLLAVGSLHRLHLANGLHTYEAYFYTYWPSFAINSILVLRVLHEMFRHAVRSVPGVQKLGRPIFFWALAVSVILAFASGITPHTNGMSLLLASAQVLQRSQSVLALCLVAFLAIASQTLGVPYSSRIFGVTFGFGILATGNLVESALFQNHPSVTGVVALGHELLYLSAIALWAVYFLKPEPARRLVTMPVTSPLMRWNEVAQTLGNPAGQVAVSYPPSFMNDVFELVNDVMGPAGWPQKAVSRPSGPMAS